MHKRTKLILAIAGGLALMVTLAMPKPCVSAWLRWGIVVEECPVGTPVPSARVVYGRARHRSPLTARVEVRASFSVGGPIQHSSAATQRFDVSFAVENDEGEARPVRSSCHRLGDTLGCALELPELPDGDHTVVAAVDSALGEIVLRTSVPVYRDAVVHLVTDQPAYRLGDVIRYRAVVLDADTLEPLDGRPGVIELNDDYGEAILTLRQDSGDFAVAAGRLPLPSSLDSNAFHTLTYRSGQASDSVFLVLGDFVLPSLAVDLRTDQPWTAVGERPVVRGMVRYRSGTPVRGAKVTIRAEQREGWPLPMDWIEGATLRTDRDGTFAWTPSAVPEDLQGRALIPVGVEIIDAAGERTEARTTIRISDAPIVATLQSELGDGLVASFPNRIFLRLTTPDGTPLDGVDLVVRRAWDPHDPGVEATTDVDAVAALTIDPGKPVSVLVPSPPTRTAPEDSRAYVERERIEDLLGGPINLDDQVLLDAWTSILEPCAIVLDEDVTRSFGVLVDPRGRVERVVTEEDEPVDRCVATKLAGSAGPSGTRRFYLASWKFEARGGARLWVRSRTVGTVPVMWNIAAEKHALAARGCVLDRRDRSKVPLLLHWRIIRDNPEPLLHWEPDQGVTSDWSADDLACIQAAFTGLTLRSEPKASAEGISTLRTEGALTRSEVPPAATVTTAWELEISASAGGEALGTTRILARPGEIPPLRLRPARSVLAAGDEVSIQLLRGPDFSSDLPDEGDIVPILQGQRRAGELSYRSEDRSFVGTIPGGVHGLLAVSWEGARAHLWVPDPSPLVVTLGTDRTSYRPGERTTITVSTREGDSPTGAAVTLSGVDFALDEVGRLIEPDDWSRVIARGRTHQASFDRFDTLALHAGRIRGEHAVQATLQRIWWNSQENEQGRIAPIETAAPLDPQEVFERAFYGTLRDLRQAVIAWEQEAPAGARLTPAVIGILLEDTLRAREAAGLPIRDAWGLRLELRRLPTSYLELLDPYRMATDARRLSEDVESWEAWVAEEAR